MTNKEKKHRSRDRDFECSVQDRFARIVSQAAESTAILANDRTTTYAQLDDQSDCIADAVQDSAPPEGPVFLLFEDISHAIAAMLACLKLGRPYVPLDPATPSARLEFIRADAKGNLLLSHRACETVARDFAGTALPIAFADDSQTPGEFHSRQVPPDALAWILYTSGSTGTPKGVMQTQRNLMHYVSVYAEGQSLTGADRISLLSSYTANIASHDIFSALLTGSTICPYDVRKCGLRPLTAWIEHTRITVFSCVPTLFRRLTLEPSPPSAFRSLRFVKLVGEPVYRRDFDAFVQMFPETCTFVNRLGSSETGTIRWLFASTSDCFDGPNVPVGYAVRHNDIALIDDEGHPVPQGEIGEIVVRSQYLSPGYWNRSDLTDAAFSGEGAMRRFRTGDMGWMLPDGCLVHVGRKDSQIKIRGYRVEVAEIEAALLSHPSIRDALVMLREDFDDDTRLAAYLIADPAESHPTTTELREHLEGKLPEYMIPNAFIHLDAFPLAPNGKILRSALPPLGVERPELEVPYVAPRTPVEQTIAAVWKTLLHLSDIGIRDNFLYLGGTSLLATRMLSHVQDQLDVQVSIKAFFDCPTIEYLAEAVGRKMAQQPDQWTIEKRIAWETRLLDQAQKQSRSIPLRQPSGPSSPLSYAQQRMWFMEQLTPDTPLYNVPWATRLQGPIELEALEVAIQQVVARHEALRTLYEDTVGSPRQTILETAHIPLRFEDLRGHDLTSSPTVTDRVLEAATRPFDLRHDLPFRATLFRLDDEAYVLLLVGHHIALDGWSRSILNREIGLHYRAGLRGTHRLLPPLPIQYADYAEWQRSPQVRETFKTELAYWAKHLAGLEPMLDLPIAEIDHACAPSDGGATPFSLSPEATRKLQDLARSSNATPFMILAAAVYALLYRYTGREDLLIGTPVAGRNRPELEPLVGLFVNTLGIRTEISGDQTFAETVLKTRDASLEAFEHQDVPFERIVAELGPERQTDRSPLVQVMLSYRTFPHTPLQLEGTVAESVDVITETAKLDLSFELWDAEDAIMGRLSFSKRRFRRERIEALAEHFVTLLSAGVRDPHEPIDSLPMLAEDERRTMLHEWNAATAPASDVTTLHGLFERTASAQPGKVAVVYENTRLTYEELDKRASQVACYLRKLGAGPDTCIGVAMHRSTDLVAALLGVLKAGAAYVPLDPLFPVARLQYMIEDVSALAIVTQPELEDRLFEGRIPVLSVTEDWYAEAPDCVPGSTQEVLPEHLAYVMYTSGSTGKPKGVMVEHRNVVGFLNAYRLVVPATPERISSTVISYAFDTSVEEIFATLCYGGTLHIVPYESCLDGYALGAYLLAHGISSAHVVPDLLPGVTAAFREWGGCGNLLCLDTGLEPKRQRLLQELRDVDPELRIINSYGPTEVTYGATAFVFKSADDPERDVSIGKPHPDYQTYIVNEALEPVPIGVPGELLIGGVGVSRGYLNRPELTSERFIPNPFRPDSPERVYRSGDTARFMDDGNIEFLGRQDRQVKIRGHRIELREVELALQSHPEVTRCHAAVHKLAPDDVRLAAYIVTVPSATISESELADRMRAFLPAYMVPSAFVILDEFPLLLTGKIDVKALPIPNWVQRESSIRLVSPRTEPERSLARIWQATLKLDRIGIHEDFFSLGGHSLLATRVVHRVSEAFGVELGIREFFDHPTIASLAAHIHSLLETSMDTSGTVRYHEGMDVP